MKSPSDKKIETVKKLTTPLETITETTKNTNIKTEKIENAEEK